ncbi:uncharacterized protein EV420DRAFT_1146874 [Desarmillaria tabescens]|uniref:Uncharacterized protein n=1 Tax=Armillaria tabescens TaxID=1929756 RepID=A0AA39NCE3_ARMTA|nr:uncharacterized protein EV420DRAFT_1146874 [Desarmillaria tabescens]KAK0462964.1 hypothetical protein EV420DRAFT_1146874 [Desarmillaria tabescens]
MSSRRAQTRRNTSTSSTSIQPPRQKHSTMKGEQTLLSNSPDLNDFLDEYALQSPTSSGVMTSTNYLRLRLHLQRVPSSRIDFFVEPSLQDRYFTYSPDVDALLYKGIRVASQDEIPYILSQFIFKKESTRSVHTRISKEYSFIPYEVVAEYYRRFPRPSGRNIRVSKKKKRDSLMVSEKENYPLSRKGMTKLSPSTALSLSYLPFPFANSLVTTNLRYL